MGPSIWDVLSFTLAALASLGAAFTYCVHDRKLKQQKSLLNQFQLAEAKEKEENRRKASIRGLLVNEGRGSNYLLISNVGESEARSIEVMVVDHSDEGCIWRNDRLFVEQLSSGNAYQFRFMTDSGASKDIRFRYSWEDDYSKGNVYEELLQRR